MVIKRDVIYTPSGKPRTLHIWLPDDYENPENAEERYPVMYFFDGHNLFSDEDATYGKCWGLADWLRSCPKPFIIVGIECGHEGRERLDEYSPYDHHGGFLGEIHGMGEQTLRWIAENIKPMIDREYRTWPGREATGIGGSSMGGLMSLYAAARWGHVFTKCACVSSAIIGTMERDACTAVMPTDMRVYLSWGTEEAGGTREDPADDLLSPAARRNIHIAETMRKHGAETMTYCQRGGHHCEADWEKQVPVFMDFLWLR